MVSRVPVELYFGSRTSGRAAVEQICRYATQGSADKVVAISVGTSDVARAATLLFGTGIGVVSTINTPGAGWIDQVRHTVACGATEIALPRVALDDPAMLGRLRSWLGPGIPLTVELSEVSHGPKLDTAADILRLGADFVSFDQPTLSPSSHRAMLDLISIASNLGRSGVKIPRDTYPKQLSESGMTRVRIPVFLPTE